MKLIQSDSKNVEYFGMTLAVPRAVRYIACDKDGECYGYQYPPFIRDKWGHWGSPSDEEIYYLIGNVDLEGMDWKDTLVEVE